MSDRLKAMYQHLIGNRRHVLRGWYSEYVDITTRISKVRGKLNEGDFDIDSSELYNKTTFQDYYTFMSLLFANKENGVSSNGQSYLSKEKKPILFKSEEFKNAMKNLILKYSNTEKEELAKIWKHITGSNTSLLTNRALAACTLNVTSTVSEEKFNTAFSWLQKEGLIDYPADGSEDWYSKNIFIMKTFKEALEVVEGVDDYWVSIFFSEVYSHRVNPLDALSQTSAQPGQGTICLWSKVGKRVENILNGIDTEKELSDLTPDLREVFCSEFLRTGLDESLPKLSSLLAPIGRTLKDVAIVGLAENGKRLLVQVTYSFEPKWIIEKLKKYTNRGDMEIILFCITNNPREMEGVRIYSIDEAFKRFTDAEIGRKWMEGMK